MMEHCPHITLTLGPFGQYLHEQYSDGDTFFCRWGSNLYLQKSTVAATARLEARRARPANTEATVERTERDATSRRPPPHSL